MLRSQLHEISQYIKCLPRKTSSKRDFKKLQCCIRWKIFDAGRQKY